MNLIETEKCKFSEKWWDKLSHCFSEKYMLELYSKILTTNKQGRFKVTPSSKDLYNRFKVIDPEDIRVVFFMNKPIISYNQSDEWKLISRYIENESFNGLNLNLENNIEYLIPQGIIHISQNFTEPYFDEWFSFCREIIKVLSKTGNKIIWIFNEDDLIETENHIKLKEGCITKINEFMRKEYNTKINW